MRELQFIFYIGLIAYSLYSIVVYLFRRSNNKSNLETLQQAGSGFRRLSSEELACLQPFLVDPLKPGKRVELLDESVQKISGEFVRHGLHVQGGTAAMHDTLGGVDVVLPYDARDFLAEANVAEVVMTPKFAIVVRLNDDFDLLGGRTRARQAQAQQQQWAAGQAGELSGQETSTATEPAAENPDTPDSGSGDIGQVHILSQRDETAAEAAARTSPGWGGLPLLPMLPAFILLLVAGHSDNVVPWLGVAIPLFLFAFWLARQQPGAPERKKVNRVQGSLNLISLQNPNNSTLISSQLFLGDKLPINMPEHWKKHAVVPPDSQVTLEMRVDDYSVVRFGKQLSVDTEQRRFPNIYWGRHLTFALTGLAMLFFAWLFIDDISGDLAHVRSALFSGGEQLIERPEAVLDQPPAVGSLVRIKASVRCQIDPPMNDGKPSPVNCRQVRWGGDAPQVADVEIPADIVKLYQGDILHARHNAAVDMMVEMAMMRDGGDPLARMMGRPSVLLVSDLTQLILGVDQECHREGVNNVSACHRLQETIRNDLMHGDDESAPTWETLVKQAKKGGFKGEDDMALVLGTVVNTLREEFRELASIRMHLLYEAPLRAALDSQRGGVILPLHFEIAPTQEPRDEADSVADVVQTFDWSAQWASYQALARPGALQAVELAGLVVVSGKDEKGQQILEINPQRNRDNALPALVRLLTMLFGAGLLGVQGLFAVKGMLRAQQRNAAVEAFYNSKAMH